jgi:predicted nucleic acid-binding protein
MKYRLFDSSVWVDYRKGVVSAQTDLLDQELNDVFVCICPVIVQEVLQGVRLDTEFEDLKNDFKGLNMLEINPVAAAINAAQLYRGLRKKGVTIRKPNDCLIAHYALHFDMELCHNDADFDLIAAHTNLKIWQL